MPTEPLKAKIDLMQTIFLPDQEWKKKPTKVMGQPHYDDILASCPSGAIAHGNY